MAEEKKDQVTGDGAGVPNGTPNTSAEVVSKETPSQTPAVDVDAIRADYEAKMAKLSQDVNNIKSTFQRREAQIQSDSQRQIAELKREMQQSRMSQMTDDDREAYEASLISEELTTLRSELETERMGRAQMQQMLDATKFFMERGVPMEKLTTNEGYEALTVSGWKVIDEELTRLRAIASNPPKKELEPLKEAPKVVTDKSIPAGGTTWGALIAQFGSREAVYRAVEEQKLHPSIIPLEG